jgi:hypothetical protein
MSRRKSIVVYAALIALGLLGAYQVGMFEGESVSRDVSGFELILALIGFFLLLGALIGIVLVIRQNSRPMSESEMREWAIVREVGKRKYILRAVLKGVLFGVLAISWPIISDYWKVKSFDLIIDSIRTYAALVLTCVFGAYYAGIRTWDANDRDFGAVPPKSRLPTRHTSN